MEETITVVKKTEAKVRIDPKVVKKRDELFDAGCCVSCGKKIPKRKGGGGLQRRRGQCDACYQVAQVAIEKGTITDAELIRAGKRLKRSKGGRPSDNPFTKFLAGKS